MINLRKRNRKTVHDYYSMDSFACGFETRAPPSDSLATTANFISWNYVIIPDVLLISFPELQNSIYIKKGLIVMEKRTLQKLGLLSVSVMLCSAASWWSSCDETEQRAQKLTEQPVVEQMQEIKITVCVSGAVAKPGLYEVTKGSRAQQVIELAGGVTEEADMDRVNLAQ